MVQGTLYPHNHTRLPQHKSRHPAQLARNYLYNVSAVDNMSPIIADKFHHPRYYTLLFRIERVCGLVLLSAIFVLAFMILITVIVEGKNNHNPLVRKFVLMRVVVAPADFPRPFTILTSRTFARRCRLTPEAENVSKAYPCGRNKQAWPVYGVYVLTVGTSGYMLFAAGRALVVHYVI
jgi:hypothetical protein